MKEETWIEQIMLLEKMATTETDFWNVPPRGCQAIKAVLARIIVLEAENAAMKQRHRTYVDGLAEALKENRQYREFREPACSDREEIEKLVWAYHVAPTLKEASENKRIEDRNKQKLEEV